MKFVLQLIGFICVLVILLTAVLFFLDSKDLLRGDLATYVNTLHGLWLQGCDSTNAFFTSSGIKNDAANLLDEGANYLRSQSPDAGTADNTPLPTNTPPAIIIITPESN